MVRQIGNVLVCGLTILLLTSCVAGIKTITSYKIEKKREPLNLQDPVPLELQDVEWIIITKENAEEVFEKINLPQEQKDELVLAIAEAAQNIVKHGYKGVEETTDRMEIKISLKDGELEIGFFDKGKEVVPENIKHRKLDDIKPGGLGTFFIKEIMDAAVFKRDQKGWVNHLVLTKKI